MLYFLQGLTVGLAYSAPIGMQNLFIINSALNSRRRRAFLTALIVAFFDIVLSLACFFGVGAVMQRFVWLQMLILLAGGLVVLVIGLRLLRAKPAELKLAGGAPSLRQTAAAACAVTWFNPQALIDGSMMLGAFHASLLPGQVLPFIAGVELASCLWFAGLTFLVSRLRSKFNAGLLRAVNVICGLVIIFYAGKLLWDFGRLLSGS